MKNQMNIAAAGILMILMLTMSVAATPISLAELALHNSPTDCWSAISGTVYNLTDFIAFHPGGPGMTLICGIDGTQAFFGQHSSGNQLSLVSSYNLGNLVTLNPPVLTVFGINPAFVVQGNPYVDAGASATDVEDGSLTSSIVTASNVNTAVPGTYNVSYTVTDSTNLNATGMRAVIVTDPQQNTPPALTVVGPNPAMVTVGNGYVDAGASATDNEDGNLTVNITMSGNVNTGLVGMYNVTYIVTDSGNLSAYATRIVQVVANQTNGHPDDELSENEQEDELNEGEHEGEVHENDEHEAESDGSHQDELNESEHELNESDDEHDDQTGENQGSGHQEDESDESDNPGTEIGEHDQDNRSDEESNHRQNTVQAGLTGRFHGRN